MWTVLLFQRNKKILQRILRKYTVSATPLQIEHALVLSKMTRYEVEKHCNPDLTDSQLEKLIRSRGSDFNSLIEHHWRHKNYEKFVLDTFKRRGIKTTVCNRLDYSDSWIESCDAVFPVGGDGTFLLGASKVRLDTKPVIGFNSDPDHSEGFLCLSKKDSSDVDGVLTRLMEGTFKWLFRTRIRVTITSKDNAAPVQLHDRKIRRLHMMQRNTECVNSQSSIPITMPPALALNEVFVGETLSAQVSYFEMRLEGRESTKVKSSGLCVSTGTGSTSWQLSMNRITGERVAQILRCAGFPDTDCDTIAKKYNRSLLFHPEDSRMCYTIRDLISASVWPSPPGLPPRGFVNSMWIRSYGRDSRLVIDGGTSYTFNDGSEVLFEILPEDKLRTVVL